MISLLVYVAAATGGGVSDVLAEVDLPALAFLGTSGVLGMIYVLRWLTKYHREVTNAYIDENTKLRVRVDDLEAEVLAKDLLYAETRKEFLAYEVRTTREIGAMSSQIARHEETISDLQRRLNPDASTGG